ncbi:hypothetical protein D3C86_2010100 [compost metagenome]
MDALRVGLEIGDGERLHNFSFGHHQDAVRDALGEVEVLLYKQDCDPFGLQQLDHVTDLLDHHRCQALRRLVEHQDFDVRH